MSYKATRIIQLNCNQVQIARVSSTATRIMILICNQEKKARVSSTATRIMTLNRNPCAESARELYSK